MNKHPDAPRLRPVLCMLGLLAVAGSAACTPKETQGEETSEVEDAARPVDAKATTVRRDAPSASTQEDTGSLVSAPKDGPASQDAAVEARSDAAGAADTSTGLDSSALPGPWKVVVLDDTFDSNYNAKEVQEGPFTNLTCKAKGKAVQEAGGKIRLTACGYDVWHGLDDFTFFYAALDGDGEVSAKLESVGANSTFGVMVRNDGFLKETDNPGAMVFFGGGTVKWGDRIVTYDPTKHTQSGDGWGPHPPFTETAKVSLPIYLKITRKITNGKDFLEGLTSQDGKTWTPIPTPIVNGKPGHPPSNTLREHTERMWVGIFGFPNHMNGPVVDGVFSDVMVNGVPAKVP